ncbi:Chd3-type chromatin-remodeling factor pickle [Thalictrum thalictroides]|uniref:Chd3-type chromatin-remodeling factor pickle n=2 Tax=Thalictrum thalictroides TaxID=46969 RepID=A0A7J6W5Y0_THATH|nr:Chd3-type chromatin-remodeling factor pickle [Thalictrum thalictroides]
MIDEEVAEKERLKKTRSLEEPKRGVTACLREGGREKKVKMTARVRKQSTTRFSIMREELDDIIRYGSKELFSDETDEAGKARQIHYDDAAIDRLLDREQIRNEEATVDDEEDDGFLKAFKVANFEYIDEVEAAAEEEAKKASMMSKTAANNSESRNYWEELLRDRYEEHRVEEFTALGKGKRSRKQMVSVEDDDLAGLEDASSDGEDDSNEADWIDAESVSSGTATGRKPQISKKKSRVDSMEPLPLMEGEGKSFKVLGFSQNQRAAFVQILMRFGVGDFDWSEFTTRLKQKTFEEIREYGTLFLSHMAEDITDSPSFSDGVPKEGLRIPDVLVRIAVLLLFREKVKKFQSVTPGTPLFAEDIMSRFLGLRSGRAWKEEHDLALIHAVLKHGYGRWQSIVEDKDLQIQHVICQEQNLLPFLNGSGGAQVHDCQNITEGASSIQVTDAGSGNDLGPDVRQGTTENANRNQLYQLSPNTYNFREMQRRLVEFIKKRVLLLEKAINAEYQKEFFGDMKPCETANEEFSIDRMVVDVESPCSLEADRQMSNQLPSIDPIGPDELSAVASDDIADRLEMARLYNEMCNIMSDDVQASVEADTGNKSAMLRKKLLPLEAIYEDMHRVLASPHNVSAMSDRLNVSETTGKTAVDTVNLLVPNGGDSISPSKSIDVEMVDAENNDIDVVPKRCAAQTEGEVIVLDE